MNAMRFIHGNESFKTSLDINFAGNWESVRFGEIVVFFLFCSCCGDMLLLLLLLLLAKRDIVRIKFEKNNLQF